MKPNALCQTNGGCMGCCGHDFISKEKIEETIHRNNQEFNELLNKNKETKTKETLIEFRERAYPSDLRNGVCRNLIEEDNHIFCPLHPARNDGEDLREGHCSINYLCKTAGEFAKWNEDKQHEFIVFVSRKNLDNVEFSLLIGDDSLLREFKSAYSTGA